MKACDADVIVAGRGIVGAAMALGLAQQGWRVLNLGPPPAPTGNEPWDRRVYALSAASLAVLDRLRVRGLLQPARLAAIRRMRIWGDAGGQLEFSAYQAHIEHLAVIAEARHLQQALDTATTTSTGLQMRVARVSGCTLEDDVIRVTTDVGDFRARLVIAADGAESPLRATLGGAVERYNYAQQGLVTHWLAERPHCDTAYQWFLGDRILALLPMPQAHLVSMVFSVPDPYVPQLMQADPALLAEQIEQASGGVLGRLRLTDPPLAFPLRYLRSQRLVGPRLALIGDAAHLMHPLAGQGLNAGLQDVNALLDSLAQPSPWRDAGDPSLLRRYERARQEDLWKMLTLTDGLKKIFERSTPSIQWVRNVGMNQLNRWSWMKRNLIAQAMGIKEF